MNEMDVLVYFYDRLREAGRTRIEMTVSFDRFIINDMKRKLGKDIPILDLYTNLDICLASGWLERTTADMDYNFLSITDSGLQMAINHRYGNVGH